MEEYFEIKCPSCGGSLNGDFENDKMKCQYCGATIRRRTRKLTSDGRVPIYDGSGKLIASAQMPMGMTATGTATLTRQSIGWPVRVNVNATYPHEESGNSTLIAYQSGAAFREVISSPTERMVEGGREPLTLTPYMKFPDPGVFAENALRAFLQGQELTFVEERPLPLKEKPDFQAQCKQMMDDAAMGIGSLGGGFGMPTPKIYGGYLNGKCMIYTYKNAQGVDIMCASMAVLDCLEWGFTGGILNGIMGGLFGGGSGGDVRSRDWNVRNTFFMITDKAHFEMMYPALIDFCSSFHIDNGIQQWMQQEGNRYQDERMRAQNAQFQAFQQAHEAQVAAFDSYNKGWWERTNAHDAAFRASSQASFGSSGADFSEAIRGVNTYVRSDGTEVEISCMYDTAYEAKNDPHTVVGGEHAGVSIGADWVEMERK